MQEKLENLEEKHRQEENMDAPQGALDLPTNLPSRKCCSGRKDHLIFKGRSLLIIIQTVNLLMYY